MINKKNGFTLIELLAVIVILAIIAVITVAIIGNIINSSKRKSAENSLYGYIETVELYQTRQILLGKSQLKESTIYNVSKETVIDDKTVEPLNNLIDIKGTKPTGGTISISKNGTVGVATLCINDYLVEYKNNEISTSDDCGDIGLLINYNIDTPDWAKSKTLTIEYPEGNFDYYLKLDKGNAKINDKVITAGEEIKVESPAELLLTENSEISTWILKGSKKLSLRKYTELKIDNVELKEPEIVTSAGYPSISTKGISISSNLTLNYTQQDGTSAYYSVDDGLTWNKYTSTVSISGSKVKAKLVRDVSKIESKIVEKSISVAADALGSNAYDGNTSTYVGYNTSSIVKYININNDMIGSNILMDFYLEKYGDITLEFYDKNNFMQYKIMYKGHIISGRQSSLIEIPHNSKKIKITFHGDNSKIRYIYEISEQSVKGIKREPVYPTLTSTGFISGYNNIKIDNEDLNIKKMYKIGTGEWTEYDNSSIKVDLGKTIYIKGIDKNNIESQVISYKSSLPIDSITTAAYDGDKLTGQIIKNNDAIMNVDNSMWGKNVKIVADKCTGVYMYNSNYAYTYGNYFSSALNQLIPIPSNTVKIKIHNYQCDNYSVKEVTPSA